MFHSDLTGSQLWATSYIPRLVYPSPVPTLDEDECQETPAQPPPRLSPSARPDLVHPHSLDLAEHPRVTASIDTSLADPVPSSPQPVAPDLPDPAISESRPQHTRSPPAYLQEYILD